MTDIKFRVRNLTTGKIVGYECLMDGMWFCSEAGTDWQNGTYVPAEGAQFQREQYTGLKDMNGVEIYKGDIIAHHDFAEPLPHAVVTWDARSASFLPGIGLMSEADEWLEVIGNICDNPELLK